VGFLGRLQQQQSVVTVSHLLGAETMSKKVDSTDIRRKMIADDAHYHAEKLGLGATAPTKVDQGGRSQVGGEGSR